MKKIITKIDYICDKILGIMVKYLLPIIIIILSFVDIIQICVSGVHDSSLTLMIFMYICAWLVCFVGYKYWCKVPQSGDEYRKYLVKELEEDVREDLSVDKLKERGREVDDRKSGRHPNIINEQRKNDKKDIIALMLKNNDEITDYFKISKNQAKSSFWFSVISCIVGMAALAFGIYGIVILKDVSVSVISLISGSISELISGTVFWVHNKSALQLNHYYDALHENEKFLSAVNIADKLSVEKREEVLIEIIHKQISSETPRLKTENTKEKEKNRGN